MKGRRSAALLCVLLVHALVVYSLLHMRRPEPRRLAVDDFVSEPITLVLEPMVEPLSEAEPEPSPVTPSSERRAQANTQGAAPPAPSHAE